VLRLISKVYKNPILVHSDVWVTLKVPNIVGGVCVDAKTQSRLNMQKVAEYLSGIPMENIGFRLDNISRVYINVKNIRKFGIDEKDIKVDNLPIKYVNEPTSFYELYKTQIWATIIVFIIVIIFLIVLAKKNKELNKYSKEIKEINKDLEKRIQDTVPKCQDQFILKFNILHNLSNFFAIFISFSV
jgi:hypothetical protein